MSTSASDGYYEALWPRSPRQSKVKPLAKRLDTLNGKTIAQVWDMVFRGDEVFEFLEEGLKARFPDIRFPPLPPRGELDLNAVKQSTYFFS